MADLPLVSISIITFNQIEFIRETLDSALGQDYENLEVVVSDDASTDGTAEVIQEYAQKYPGRLIALIGGPNLGITANDNRALKACRGKYIAFQGGDDVLLQGKISAQVQWFEEDKRRVLCGHQVEVFYDDGNPSHVLTPKLPSGAGPRWVIEHGCPYGAVAIMVRAENIPSMGFDERLPTVSDQKFWIDCLRDNGIFGYVAGIYARYRKHSSNITNDYLRCSADLHEMVTILKQEYPQFSDSVRKYSRNLVDMSRAKLLLQEGRYLKAIVILGRTCVLSPSRLLRTFSFRLTKINGSGALILYYTFARFLPGMAGYIFRKVLCKRIFCHAGKNVNIRPGVRFGRGSLISISDNSGLGDGAYLVGMAPILIGNNVMTGPQIMILTGGHALKILFCDLWINKKLPNQ